MPGLRILHLSQTTISRDPTVTTLTTESTVVRHMRAPAACKSHSTEAILDTLHGYLCVIAQPNDLSQWLNYPTVASSDGSNATLVVFLRMIHILETSLKDHGLEKMVATFDAEQRRRANTAEVPLASLQNPARVILAATAHLASSISPDICGIRKPSLSGHMEMAGLGRGCDKAVRALRLFTVAQATVLQQLPLNCDPWRLCAPLPGQQPAETAAYAPAPDYMLHPYTITSGRSASSGVRQAKRPKTCGNELSVASHAYGQSMTQERNTQGRDAVYLEQAGMSVHIRAQPVSVPARRLPDTHNGDYGIPSCSYSGGQPRPLPTQTQRPIEELPDSCAVASTSNSTSVTLMPTIHSSMSVGGSFADAIAMGHAATRHVADSLGATSSTICPQSALQLPEFQGGLLMGLNSDAIRRRYNSIKTLSITNSRSRSDVSAGSCNHKVEGVEEASVNVLRQK